MKLDEQLMAEAVNGSISDLLISSLGIPRDILSPALSDCNYASTRYSWGPPALPEPLAAVPVVVSWFICEVPRFIRWKRNHRRSRINKKWHRKYGTVMTTCRGACWRVGKCFVVCPHFKGLLEGAM